MMSSSTLWASTAVSTFPEVMRRVACQTSASVNFLLQPPTDFGASGPCFLMILLTLPILTCMQDAICLTLRPESRRERIEVILEEESGLMMVRKQFEQLFGHV